MEQEEFLTIEEVAKRLRITGQTVRKLIRGKQLRAVRVGTQLRVRKEDLEQYLRSQEV